MILFIKKNVYEHNIDNNFEVVLSGMLGLIDE